MKQKLALTFAAATLSAGLMAEVAQIDGIEWTYSLDNGHAVIEGVTEGFEGSISIPSSIGGYPVKCIGPDAFSMQTGITSVTIPEGITEMRGRLYDYFGEDSDLVIPDGVTDITEWTFYGWDSLSSVVMPDSVTNIESMAFFMCGNLHTIKFGSGLKGRSILQGSRFRHHSHSHVDSELSQRSHNILLRYRLIGHG